MKSIPDLLYAVDVRKEETAVHEANLLNIPVIGLVDTNCDPRGVDYVIPSNDDAIRAIKLLTSTIANAALEGIEMRKDREIDEDQIASAPQEVAASEMTDEELLGEATLAKLQTGEFDEKLATPEAEAEVTTTDAEAETEATEAETEEAEAETEEAKAETEEAEAETEEAEAKTEGAEAETEEAEPENEEAKAAAQAGSEEESEEAEAEEEQAEPDAGTEEDAADEEAEPSAETEAAEVEEAQEKAEEPEGE